MMKYDSVILCRNHADKYRLELVISDLTVEELASLGIKFF